PNPAWLNFVVTGKARSNIKHFLKKQQKEESIELGKRLIEKSLRSLGLEFTAVPETHFQTVADATKLDSINHLFEEVGIGNRTAILVAKQLMKLNDAGDTLKLTEHSHSHALAIKGTEGLIVTYAKCCRPIPGDPIAGYI